MKKQRLRKINRKLRAINFSKKRRGLFHQHLHTSKTSQGVVISYEHPSRWASTLSTALVCDRSEMKTFPLGELLQTFGIQYKKQERGENDQP